LRRDLPDDTVARSFAATLKPLLGALGFVRDEAAWRSSRTDRFRFQHSTDKVDLEFLCGPLDVGRPSRRKPAWEIAADPDGGMGFYASRVEWLDFIGNWQAVEVRCASHAASIDVPDLPGIAVLKLRAVADKIERIGVVTDGALEHERTRLQRHGQDFRALFEWIDERGEFATLFALSREHAEIGETARRTTRWLITHSELVEQLALIGLDRQIERLTGR
jgi:hypothetical protein